MATSVNALPLLHKYVLSPQDDMELTMTKLKYRLCVKEVSMRTRGMDLIQDNAFEDNSPSPLNGKTDDSGLENDFVILGDSRYAESFDEISDEFQDSRQSDSLIDDAHTRETFPSSSSSSSSSSSASETDEEEPGNKEQDSTGQGQSQGQETEQEPRSAKFEIYGNFRPNGSVPSGFSTVGVVPCSAYRLVPADENPDFEEEPERKLENQDSVPLLYSTERPFKEQVHLSGENKTECDDVLEALRILKTRNELPRINARKTPIVTFSYWNFADLVHGPQIASTAKQEETSRRKSELQATNERILSREKRMAEVYRKIRERDEEDQRLLEELVKKQTIPDAEPLPPPATTTTTATVIHSAPRNSDPIPKSSLGAVGKVDDPPPRSGGDTLRGKSALDTAEGPAKKKKKRREGVLQSVVHSLQRRFSRRGREKVT